MGIPRSTLPTDYWLASLVILLVGFGLLMVYSASFIYAQERTGDGYFFIKRQFLFAVLGGGACFIASRIEARRWYDWSLPFLGAATFLLVAVLIPGFGVRAGGAQRWIHLGLFNFQPSEIAKIAFLLFVSRQLTRKKLEINSFKQGILPVVLPVLPMLALLLFQPDFGSAAILSVILIALFFLAGVSWKRLLIPLAVGGGAGALLIFTSPYRMTRLMTFLDPWKDPFGKGFQILQSLVGFHLGGFFGTGLGNGKEKLFFLPEAHNDFIFAVIGEELGFLGVVGVIVAFIAFSIRGFRIAWRSRLETRDEFAPLLASGLTLLIAIQAFTNMAVVLGLVPTKGLTLPFVSYGGSSIVIELFATGILLSLARAGAGGVR